MDVMHSSYSLVASLKEKGRPPLRYIPPKLPVSIVNTSTQKKENTCLMTSWGHSFSCSLFFLLCFSLVFS